MSLFSFPVPSCLRSLVPVFLLFIGVLPSSVHAGYTVLQTTNTGAQTFLNQNVGYYWKFSVDVANVGPYNTVDVGLSIKYVGQTSTPVLVRLLAANGTVVGSATRNPDYTPNQFNNLSNFTVATNYTFTAGAAYYLTITSIANTSSQTWQIKSGNISGTGLTQDKRGFYDPQSNPTPPFNDTNPPPAPEVPEPTSLAVWGLAVWGLAGARRRLLKS